MLFNVTIRDAHTLAERIVKLWASGPLDALERAVGRCKRYQRPIRAERTRQ